ncbi:response regulator [Alkalicoccus halolimnae]|uniref:Response regulator n=1 Tax=Alkalicoccus halolimnae TaxID=1667239 RepID=A0A5C7F3A2_9BACI|nr:response regulator [Alkalicoccus halolimnae]TXF83583.1 response regulator [Alkalicoccus halolimnae]
MSRSYTVFIVEDDFRVAQISRKFVESVPGFEVAGEARSAAETKAALGEEPVPDIIILDVFIPDTEGMDLFNWIRRYYPSAAVIMLTAAGEAAVVEEAFRGGAFDYMVKPVDKERLSESLLRYAEQAQTFREKEEFTQDEIDRLFHIQVQKKGGRQESAGDLPKGIDPITLRHIEEMIGSEAGGITAVEAGKVIGASRSTARRYLEYLVKTGKVEALLNYGDVGRPERKYVRKNP